MNPRLQNRRMSSTAAVVFCFEVMKVLLSFILLRYYSTARAGSGGKNLKRTKKDSPHLSWNDHFFIVYLTEFKVQYSCTIYIALSRKQIWAEMKSVCEKARVAASKVFPHNLRHLFARTFYKVCRDVARLADVLGHSSIETTRIYLISTEVEHARTLELLRLVT